MNEAMLGMSHLLQHYAWDVALMCDIPGYRLKKVRHPTKTSNRNETVQDSSIRRHKGGEKGNLRRIAQAEVGKKNKHHHKDDGR